MPGSKGRLAARLSVLLAIIALITQPALAQRRIPESPAATSGYISASGAVAYGFTLDGAAVVPSAAFDMSAILPGSNISGAAKRLLERLWRGSPTFRRQCARIAGARVAVAVDFHHPRDADDAHAGTAMTRSRGLRATIHLRADGVDLVMHLAHEVEHVLEQLDHVDLALAVAGRVHGARATRYGEAFETSRAVAIGRLVAREVEAVEHRR
jgi:hypothetical protein